jgi:hypothetical protein
MFDGPNSQWGYIHPVIFLGFLMNTTYISSTINIYCSIFGQGTVSYSASHDICFGIHLNEKPT